MTSRVVPRHIYIVFDDDEGPLKVWCKTLDKYLDLQKDERAGIYKGEQSNACLARLSK